MNRSSRSRRWPPHPADIAPIRSSATDIHILLRQRVTVEDVGGGVLSVALTLTRTEEHGIRIDTDAQLSATQAALPDGYPVATIPDVTAASLWPVRSGQLYRRVVRTYERASRGIATYRRGRFGGCQAGGSLVCLVTANPAAMGALVY
jgi:hypothetical protein